MTLTEWKALALKATKGPWEARPWPEEPVSDDDWWLTDGLTNLGYEMSKADAQFCAASSPERVIELLDALERWSRARKIVLTYDDRSNADFKAAWNELSEAEWALAALSESQNP